jgi:hypothetical protein
MKQSFNLNELIDKKESFVMDSTYEIDKSYEIKAQVTEIIAFCLKKDNTLMRKEKMDEYKQVLMYKFTNFHQKFPTLFFTLIENPSTFPIYRLDEMLKLKQKIEKNEINEEKASVHLGQKYYNEFVKDTVTHLDKN